MSRRLVNSFKIPAVLRAAQTNQTWADLDCSSLNVGEPKCFEPNKTTPSPPVVRCQLKKVILQSEMVDQTCSVSLPKYFLQPPPHTHHHHRPHMGRIHSNTTCSVPSMAAAGPDIQCKHRLGQPETCLVHRC